MANRSESRSNTPGMRENPTKRGTQPDSTSQMSGPSKSQHNSSEDQSWNRPGGPGTSTSQYTNAGSTGTGSGQISPHNPASGQSSSSGRSAKAANPGQSSGADRNT